MANALTAFSPKYWSKRMQMVHEKEVIYRAIANFEERETLRNGQTVDRPYRSAMYAQNYTKGTDVTIQDISGTSEELTVNTAKIVPFYVDDLDELQNKWNTVDAYAEDAANDLYEIVDADVLAEYASAASDLDDADFGGTAGLGITVDTTNILQLFTRAGKKLRAQNIKKKDWFAVISPEVEQVLLEYLGGKESALGDTTNENGHIGKFMGFAIYVSNNLTFTARLEFGTTPTADDTVTVAGVAFTFKATPASAGQVDIGADAPTSLDNLVAAINNSNGYAAGAGSATAYFEVSAADRNKLRNVTATDGTTYMTIEHKGGSWETSTELAETLTAAADIWTSTKRIQHNLFGKNKAIDLVIQKQPNVKFTQPALKLGRNVLPWVLYGKKTFVEGTKMLVDVNVRTSAF